MIILTCIIIFIIMTVLEDNAKCHTAEREYDHEVSERRHREMMDSMKSKPRGKRKTTRRIVRKGDVTLGEEVMEEDL